jgi:cellulose synthase/poly-beta-1,6-N-acetylglucosamine synthase-like glycosyltransferase
MDGDNDRGRTDPTGLAGYDYERYSTLTGPFRDVAPGEYRFACRRLPGWRPVRTSLLMCFALLAVAAFLVFLLQPAHWPSGRSSIALTIADLFVAVNTGIIGLLTVVNVATMCRASLIARDPIPVRPQPRTRVAFVTTIVPDREPLAMVVRTLEAARAIKHDGRLDVWLLDEGADASVREACDAIGVHYFTRKGIGRYNRPSGSFKARTKHGNYNAWLDAHGAGYDFMISLDSDHVPLENFAERFLGYFRDPDVAFVVGPQVYGNYQGFVTKSAESQQFLFHSILQRAGNRTRSAMFVGTNNAVRIAALRAIGGLRDSITEDLATSLAIHASRNPVTGRRWTSVYTPDVIAVGEGPDCFSDFFNQQYRWSRGSNDELVRRFWRLAIRMRPGQLLNYSLLMAYYPSTAAAWTLGVTNSVLYMTLGVWGVRMPVHLWLMLYLDVATLQTCVYFWNRRHNVSPHETPGSHGIAGMFISALSVPVYCSSLVGSLMRRKSQFVVTSKGGTGNADTLRTFSKHLRWAAVIVAAIVASAFLGWRDPTMYVWAGLSLTVSLLPVAIWQVTRTRSRAAALDGTRQAPAAERAGGLAGEARAS